MEEEIELKNIKHESKGFCYTWEYKEIDGNTRCFYKRIEYDAPNEKVGFDFVIVEIIGWCSEKEIFDKDNPASILFEGTAYFDGIRHLYMGSNLTNNFGYDYYPNLERSIKSLKILRELEIAFCRDLD